jgi:signal transduction histidine kinase
LIRIRDKEVAVFSQRPIRNKLFIGSLLLFVIVAALAYGGFCGVYSYRSLVRGMSFRAAELPLAAELSEQLSDLRIMIGRIRSLNEDQELGPFRLEQAREDFLLRLTSFQLTLEAYRLQLADREEDIAPIGDRRPEEQTVGKIEQALSQLQVTTVDTQWCHRDSTLASISDKITVLHSYAEKLPSFLHERMKELAHDVRNRYRTVIVLTWITSLLALVTLIVFVRLFYRWVFRPLKVLILGSRRVAAGEFSHRIQLDTDDEMSELAGALNDMTSRFQAIRDDLDHQVQERTKQVVRSEQLASVGFLAAGVAHEINNPLASIAMCAESLEDRLKELGPKALGAERQSMLHYLEMMQKEAFRCKGITERLLDFARLGDWKRHPTELCELVGTVIDMVRHIGKYQGKRLIFQPHCAAFAAVNPQEIKQVVLNLVTNALDSLDENGEVRVEIGEQDGQAQILVRDNGCGMTAEVLQHLFEPFFTRRRTGQGIGLGLSITYRIIADHQGTIAVHSAGPGEGATFDVRLPICEQHKEYEYRHQAA